MEQFATVLPLRSARKGAWFGGGGGRWRGGHAVPKNVGSNKKAHAHEIVNPQYE